MLDKTSKQILEYLYNCSDYTFHANHGYPEQFTQADFLAATDFLEENGYVSTLFSCYHLLSQVAPVQLFDNYFLLITEANLFLASSS